MAYAENTTVPVERSKAELEKLLTRAGADTYATLSEPGRHSVAFSIKNRNVRFDVPIPAAQDFKMTGGKHPRKRTEKQMWQAYEQEVKRRWRALVLCVKAKLEVVETGISTFEQEFLAHIVVEGGKTIGQEMIPRLDDVAAGGPLLLGMG